VWEPAVEVAETLSCSEQREVFLVTVLSFAEIIGKKLKYAPVS
jgi:hypothetical protein